MTTLWMLHISLVSLSLSLFVWRGMYMWREAPIRLHVWKRMIPDMIDTLLLISGISLTYILGFSPWHDDWLLIKLVGLIVYIFLGIMALRESETLWLKRAYFMLALLVATYMIAVAHSQSVFPWH
ncbi:MAG: SirB2 family protein [Mariprofundaceae bacterium]|nr:SirB2 family protein [Mariprofundaceae bacterium]